jgi:hypothetical protein
MAQVCAAYSSLRDWDFERHCDSVTIDVRPRHSLLKADASSKMVTVKSTRFRRFVGCLAGGLLLLLGAAYTLRRRPILFHAFADTGCACGEYHAEVTGLIVRNPFRDSLPEQGAAMFLNELREGRCTADASLYQYALDGHRVSDWRLVNRHDNGHGVLLFYKLTKYAAPNPKYKLSGEGQIEVVPTHGSWTVANYSSYF